MSSDDLTSDDLLGRAALYAFVEFQKLRPHHFRYGNSSPRHSRPVLDDVRMLFSLKKILGDTFKRRIPKLSDDITLPLLW